MKKLYHFAKKTFVILLTSSLGIFSHTLNAQGWLGNSIPNPDVMHSVNSTGGVNVRVGIGIPLATLPTTRFHVNVTGLPIVQGIRFQGLTPVVNPVSVGFNNLLITDAAGNVAHTNINNLAWLLTGNTITPNDFIGTLNADDFRIRTNNLQRMVVVGTGPTAGNVGINIAAPVTRFHVIGGGLFIGSTADPVLNLGAGQRMHWYSRSAAFRAGSVDGAHWDDANIGAYSAAFGRNTIASAFYSMAGGLNAQASAQTAFAFGENVIASNGAATAFGVNNTANGPIAFVIGSGNTSSGEHSFAGGLNSQATGSRSFAYGNEVRSNSESSFSLGSQSTANAPISFALGNQVQTGPVASYSFAIGSGGGVANPLINTIGNSMMVGFGSDLPTFFIGSSSGIGTTGNVGIGTTTPGAKLQVGNLADGSFALANSWSLLSDKNFKKDIRQINDPLSILAKLKGVNYSWISNGKADIGFIAQEVEEVLPMIVHTDDNGIKSMDYNKITPLLVEALKEQQVMIENLKAEITQLKNGGATLAARNSLTIENTDGILLYQNTPNPFDQITEIKFYIPFSVKEASLYIYNMNGVELKKNDISERGNSSVEITGGELVAGMYIYALIADGKEADTKRMIITK